jgi:acyl-homoserine-lactone acylase
MQTTDVLWDTWGVPHVYGADDAALFYGFGWAQMHSHGDLLTRLYGRARGRAAEYWGAAELASDRLVRTMGFHTRSHEWLAAQAPAMRANLEAFAAGLNAYAARYPERLAPEVRVALPLTAADVLAHMQRVMFTFLASDSEGALTLLGEGLPNMPGSNAWAITPPYATGGHATLLANPHLPWFDLYLFYEAHLAGPDVDVYGVTLLGMPVLTIGFNEYLGWTHTVNTHDGFDAYALSPTPDGAGYLLDGVAQPYETTTETLLVREPDGALRAEELVVRRSAHGPLLGERDGQPIAVRVVGVDQAQTPGIAAQWWAMSKAHNLAAFEAALRQLQLSMFTVMYADRDGHILSLFGGQTPVRNGGDFAQWARVQPGERSDNIWSAIHPYDDLPRVVDPPAGWVQNSNCPPWHTSVPSPLDPAAFPPYLAPRYLDFREQRALRMLRERTGMSFEELLAAKHSTRSELADRLLDELVAAARQSSSAQAHAAADTLSGWDRCFDVDSRGAALFAGWTQAVKSSGELYASDLFATAWDPERPFDTPCGLADPAAAVAALERAAAQLREAHGALDVPWGEVARLRRGAVDLPANGAIGDPLGVFRVTGFLPDADGRQKSLFGDTFVLAVEFSDPPRAEALLSYGNSSQPGSPHIGDQLELYQRKQLRPVWRRRAEIEDHLSGRDTLPPLLS